MTLSEQIKNCKDGVHKNPFQGNDKKVVFVCSMGILRSATGARLYSHKYNTRTCGTWDDALIPLTASLIEWADELVFVNKENFLNARELLADFIGKPTPVVRVLNIPDEYNHMHPRLVEEFIKQYEPL